MNTTEERKEIDRIRSKQERGEKLSPKEEEKLHYSAFGYAAGCRCKK